MTALMWACATKNEAAALLLMEATQKAGALDVQVNVVSSVWNEEYRCYWSEQYDGLPP
jgi:hypothetical protein